MFKEMKGKFEKSSLLQREQETIKSDKADLRTSKNK